MTTTSTTTSTTTTTTMVATHERAAFGNARYLVDVAGAILGAMRSRWNDVVEAGQLGPSEGTVIGRHTGARI